jgi:hypothetical protein
MFKNKSDKAGFEIPGIIHEVSLSDDNIIFIQHKDYLIRVRLNEGTYSVTEYEGS